MTYGSLLIIYNYKIYKWGTAPEHCNTTSTNIDARHDPFGSYFPAKTSIFKAQVKLPSSTSNSMLFCNLVCSALYAQVWKRSNFGQASKCNDVRRTKMITKIIQEHLNLHIQWCVDDLSNRINWEEHKNSISLPENAGNSYNFSLQYFLQHLK